MFVFVSGPARSGKSAWAEECALSLSGAEAPLVYLATARVQDQEMRRRVLGHQARRKGRGFETLERETDVSGLALGLDQTSVVLLECLGTLLANEMFAPTPKGAGAVVPKIWGDISLLRARVADLLVVSNDVFSDGVAYGEETEAYRRALGELHRRLAPTADLAVECVFGQIAVYRGATPPWAAPP